MENKMTKLFKIAFAILAVLVFGAIGGLIVSVSAEGAEAEAPSTLALKLEPYRTYSFYPEGYQENSLSIEPFEGTYILTGAPTENVTFKSNGEPVTYNVIFHNLYAEADMWYGMLGVEPGVTLNITVYGDNSLLGYNHPGISFIDKDKGDAPVVNITMTENSRLTSGSLYTETENCIASDINVTLTNGTSSLDMTEENWQNTRYIEFTNGKDFSHEMKYVFVSDSVCRYLCTDCDVVTGIDETHYIDYERYDEEHPDYAAKHRVVCYQCENEFETADHLIRYESDESTHLAICYSCGYRSDTVAHAADENGCTVCSLAYTFKLESDGETANIFLIDTLEEILSEKGGKATLLRDVTEYSNTTIYVPTNTEFDLNGKTLQGLCFNVEANAEVKVTDTSANGAGKWKYPSAGASYVTSGTLTVENVTVDSVNIIVWDGGELTVKDVSCPTQMTVCISDGSADISAVTFDGTLNLTLDAYWSDVEFILNNINVATLNISSNYIQEYNVNMLLPEGYVFANEGGVLDGSGTSVENVTAIIPHTEHDSSKQQANSADHWMSCACGYSVGAVREPHTLGTDGLCGVCKEKLVASVTAGETTAYFTDLVAALNSTNDYDESTVTLLADFKPVNYGEISLKKAVTLDLNGYTYLTNGRLRVWVSLTVNDSSADKTGKLYSSSDTSYIIEFYDGSTVTLNDGEYFGLIYGALYGSDENATIIINGGRYIGEEKFRLNTGTKITVNGGVFECEVSVFNHVWSDKVVYEFNGGIFINSRVFDAEEDNLPVLESMMGKSGDCDLCFISTTGEELTAETLATYYEGEIFIFHKGCLTVASSEEHGFLCTSCDVRTEKLPHTGVYVPSDDGTSHTKLCAYCEWIIETAEHTGGETTCTDKAACELCSAPYGSEPQGHKYDNECDSECNVCNDTREVPDHVYDNECDADCNVCKGVREVADHVYENGACIYCDSADPNASAPSSGGGAGSGTGEDTQNGNTGGENDGGQDGTEPKDSGIGAVGITLITVGAVVVLGGGITAFIILRKKKFSNI